MIKSEELGLPSEYDEFSEFFDSVNVNINTDEKNAFLSSILKQFNCKNILDITCGTGSQVFHLLNDGFNCEGSDFSENLISLAKKKNNIGAKFTVGDMRNIQLGSFDAIISIFNAIGHLSKDDFKIAINNIKSNLNNDGIYIFDIINIDALDTDRKIQNLAYHINKQVDDTSFHMMQCSNVDKTNNLLNSYNQYMIQRKDNKPLFYSRSNSLKIYKREELINLLNKEGFNILDIYDFDTKKPFTKNTQSMLFVCRKK